MLFASPKNLPADPSSITITKSWFHGKTSTKDRKDLMASLHPGVMYVDKTGKTVMLTNLQRVYLPSTGLFASEMASFGPSLVDSSPVIIPSALFDKVVISVGSKADALALNIATLSDTTNDPGNAKNQEGESLPDNFTFDMDDPVFLKVPPTCPVLPGSQLPHDLDLTKEIPEAVLAGLKRYERVWLLALRFLWQHNNGLSLHTHQGRFSSDETPLDAFTVPGSGPAAIPAPVDEGTVMTSKGFDFEPTAVDTEAHQTYKQEFTRLRQELCRQHTETDNVPVATGTATTAPHLALLDKALTAVTAVTNAAVAKKPDTVQNAVKEKLRIKTQTIYEIFFAGYKKQDDGTRVLTLATLNPNFDQFLQASNSDAIRLLHDALEQLESTMDPTRVAYDSHYDWNPYRLQSAAVASIQRGQLSTRNNDLDVEDKHSFSLLQCLPPSCGDKELAAYIQENADALMQVAMGEDVTKQKAKKTHVYDKGRCTNLADIRSLIANFANFARFVIDDLSLDEPPFILLIFDSFLKLLSTKDAANWERKVDLQFAAPCLLQELMTIFNEMSSIARSSSVQKAVDGRTLPIANLFRQAEDQSNDTIRRINDGIRSSRCPRDFTERPAIASRIGSTPPTTSGKRQSEDSPPNKSPSPKKPKSTEQSGKTEDRKKLGLFKFTGEGKIPMPNFKYTNAKGESSTLCCDFVFIGKECCGENAKISASQDLISATVQPLT